MRIRYLGKVTINDQLAFVALGQMGTHIPCRLNVARSLQPISLHTYQTLRSGSLEQIVHVHLGSTLICKSRFRQDLFDLDLHIEIIFHNLPVSAIHYTQRSSPTFPFSAHQVL